MRVPSPAARMIDNSSAMRAPITTPEFTAFYGRNVLGNHYAAAMVNSYRHAIRRRAAGHDLAKPGDHFRASDITFWGVFALVAWTVAVLGANLSAFIPSSVL